MTLPVTAQAAFAATLVDEWVRAGVTDAVVAPGSRSTPLALALADAADAGRLRLHVHLDERSAGFFAVGLGVASGRPAPVVTTSGTAPAHLLPAVIEAHHARVPMVVCTADRPPELHHVGAPQTIEQDRLFEGLLRWQAHVGAVVDLPPGAWRSLGARSVAEAGSAPAGPGPVQLNLGFRDPLVGAPGALVPPGRSGGRPWHGRGGHPAATVPMTTEATSLLSGRAGIIVAGSGITDPSPVLGLGRALGWPVLAGPRSRCRGPASGSDGAVVVSAFDAILRHAATAARLRPDAVLRLGAPMASAALAGCLKETDGEQVVADPFGTWADPERRASLVVAADPEALCRSILANGPSPAPDGWAAAWRAAETTAQQTVETVLATHPEVTEPGVARAVTGVLPAEAALVVASSMPVRDVEWYGDPAMTCTVMANRGANGIDGLVSTALGVAAARRGPTVALLGDLALLHDGGGLLGAARRGLDCTYVVVDNDGGGIFSFLPQADALAPSRFERLFGTPHGVDLAALAAVHAIPVSAVTEAAGLAPGLTSAVAAGGVRLILLRSNRAANVAVHDELVRAVADALSPP